MAAEKGKVVRTFADECAYIKTVTSVQHDILKGFVPNMRVDGAFYVNSALMALQMEELAQYTTAGGVGGFLPAMKQIANVAALPGIVGKSVGLPDVHSGYGFAIGNVAAFDMSDKDAIVSPGGVGFDINCGVRLLRTNLTEKDVAPVKEALAQALFDHIPVGVGSKGIIPTTSHDLEAALEMGMDWSLREGYAWAEDKEHCFAPETEVLLADGSHRAIGDCAVGDRLVDERGNARTITRYATGQGPLYSVVYGNDHVMGSAGGFTCNGGHQLVVYYGAGVNLSGISASGAAVSADAPGLVGYRVTYTNMVHDEALGCLVPTTGTMDFCVGACADLQAAGDPGATLRHMATASNEGYPPTITPPHRALGSTDHPWLHCKENAPGRTYLTLPMAHAAAVAFAQVVPHYLLWEPSVRQYRAFIARYPDCEHRCHMMRAAPPSLPQPPSGKVFSELVGLAYADAEAAGAKHMEPAARASSQEVAYLVGLWLGDGHKEQPLLYMPKPDAGMGSPLDFVERVAPMLGLEVQVWEATPGEVGGSLQRTKPYLHVRLSTASGHEMDANPGCHRLTAHADVEAGTGVDGSTIDAGQLRCDESTCNPFACLLERLGMVGAGGETPPSSILEQAVLHDMEEVRAALLAGLIDAGGSRHGATWKLVQKDAGSGTGGQWHLPVAQLAWRAALSIGFCARMSRHGKDAAPPSQPVRQAVVCITAPGGGTDILSPLLRHTGKRVPVGEPGTATERRWSRGAQLYHFTTTPAGWGPYISVEVDGPDHRFLLADCLVVHNCEEYGRMLNADPTKVTKRAKKRGLPQLGTLGAGNHYAEVQVVDEIYDRAAASRMGIEEVGQVCVMIHSGSRGLGHQVATDSLVDMERAMARDHIETNDRQLACARIWSPEGQTYLAAMAAAANYAWVNRASMTFLTRQAFAKTFSGIADSPDDLDMHVIYDVSHNIAKVEEHLVDGRPKKLLVHRKGATRAFPPHHPLIPVDYQFIGQPVLIGGTMGTASYVLTGTDKGMMDTFGSTAHGAGRASSRAKSRRTLTYDAVLDSLKAKGISIRVASPKLVMEEAPESYKDVDAVIDTCHTAGISNKAIKLRPIAVVKG